MRAEIEAFLERTGWSDAKRTPLAGDASHRFYERLVRDDGGTAILMVAPPDGADTIQTFSHIAEHLLGHGFSAPRILTEPGGNRLLLIEDLGDGLFARVADSQPDQAETLYQASVDVLVALHALPVPSGLTRQDVPSLVSASLLVLDWYAPDVDAAGRERFEAEMRAALEHLDLRNPVLVLRDYHSENLIWLPRRDGIARVGLLDFQDALEGHPAYDLISLLEDARRDLDPRLRDRMIRHYIGASGVEPGSLELALAVLGAQRNLRILGVFARLGRSHGKPGYVDLIPRVWGHLQTDLRHPILAPLRRLVEEAFPLPTAAHLGTLRTP